MSILSRELLHHGPDPHRRLIARLITAEGQVRPITEADAKRPLNPKDGLLLVRYTYDQTAQNPLENMDGYGRIWSLGHRHGNYDPERVKDALTNDPDAIPLSYFEHGLCRWGVQGSMGGMPDFEWDGVHLAGVWIPDDDSRQECPEPAGTPARRAWMEQRAKEAAELYTAWCNGGVYLLGVAVYALRADQDGLILDPDYYYDNKEALDEQTCGEVYEEGAESVLDDLLVSVGLSGAVRDGAEAA